MAFFFQGDNLLLPADFPDSRIPDDLPADLAKDFENPDIFRINALEPPGLTDVVSVSSVPGNWRSIPIRRILGILGGCSGNPENQMLSVILRACHISGWRRESRFCGQCGSRNIDAGYEPKRRCPECGKYEFPRICPAVIVAITDNKNRILLAHNKRFKPGVYSHLSGFIEAGESPEETVVREVREEVNIKVKNIKYVKSQPWPFPNSLMLGFTADYLSGTIQPDGTEIEDAKWFTPEDLQAAGNMPELPPEGSLARFLINRRFGN